MLERVHPFARRSESIDVDLRRMAMRGGDRRPIIKLHHASRNAAPGPVPIRQLQRVTGLASVDQLDEKHLAETSIKLRLALKIGLRLSVTPTRVRLRRPGEADAKQPGDDKRPQHHSTIACARFAVKRVLNALGPPDDGSRPLPGDGDGRTPGRPGPPADGSRPLPDDEAPPEPDDDEPDDEQPEEDCPTQEEIDALRSEANYLRMNVVEEEEKVSKLSRKVADAESAVEVEKASAAKAGLDTGRCLLLLPLGPAGPKMAAACVARTAGPAAAQLVAALVAFGLAKDALREAEEALEKLRTALERVEDELAALAKKKRACESRRNDGAAAPPHSEEAEKRKK